MNDPLLEKTVADAQTAPLLAVGIRKRFGDLHVLDGISLDVPKGNVTCLIGPSGSGKSTLLRCMNHLTEPDEGYVLVDGECIGWRPVGAEMHQQRPAEIARTRQVIGMVFQSFNLFEHLTALENVALGPRRVGGVRKSQANDEARRLLSTVGLDSKAQNYPHQLSGGQQQRVAIARALAMNPKVMLFDEPTSALDPELVGEVLRVMENLAAGGMTMIVSTHEMSFARAVANDVVFLASGRVVEQGPPSSVLDDPQQDRTIAFLSHLRRDTKSVAKPQPAA